MTYGLTGNPSKDTLWPPVADLARWLRKRGLPFCLHETVAQGLAERKLLDTATCQAHATAALAHDADLVLSFGGDGTFLNTAHEIGPTATPILGVNIGRLGFLADVEVGKVQEAITQIEEGQHRIERRLVMEAVHDGSSRPQYALNDLVLAKSGSASMIRIHVEVDGAWLNTYWADGLILSTPTGSTAYSLAAGGPIIVPESGVVVLTPLAPHTLTVRPIVLPASATLRLRVETTEAPYLFAADGRSTLIEAPGPVLTVRRASYDVHLVKLPGLHYFQTLRGKLMWGTGKALGG